MKILRWSEWNKCSTNFKEAKSKSKDMRKAKMVVFIRYFRVGVCHWACTDVYFYIENLFGVMLSQQTTSKPNQSNWIAFWLRQKCIYFNVVSDWLKPATWSLATSSWCLLLVFCIIQIVSSFLFILERFWASKISVLYVARMYNMYACLPSCFCSLNAHSARVELLSIL